MSKDTKESSPIQSPPTPPPPQRSISISDDYDPYLHRTVENPSSNLDTFINLLKSSIGSGILAIPQAFSRAGYFVGILCTLIIGAVSTYTLQLIIDGEYIMCCRRRVPMMGYAEAMKFAILEGPEKIKWSANLFAKLVDVFVITYQLGLCCVYVLFVAENIKAIVDQWFEMSVLLYIVILIVPLLAINSIRNLKKLTPFTLVANLLILVALIIVIYYVLSEDLSPEPIRAFESIEKFPLFFGTILFALSPVGMITSLENNMKTPADLRGICGVLVRGMAIITILYTVFGLIGYTSCSSECKDSITLDLPFETLALLVKLFYAIAVFISHALNFYVPVEIIFKNGIVPRKLKDQPEKKILMWEFAFRYTFVLGTIIIAALVPRLGLFISLLGAFCISALGFFFPVIMNVCIRYPKKDFGKYNFHIFLSLFLFGIGMFGFFVGSITAIVSIVQSFF